MKISVLDFNVDHFRSVQLFKFQNLISQIGIFKFKILHLLIVSNSQVFVISKLVFKFDVLIVISSFKFADFILKEKDLRGVISLKSLNFSSLFMAILFLCVFELSLKVMTGPSHQIFKLISFFFESDFSSFISIDKIVNSDGEDIEFLDLIFEHVLELLNMGLV